MGYMSILQTICIYYTIKANNIWKNCALKTASCLCDFYPAKCIKARVYFYTHVLFRFSISIARSLAFPQDTQKLFLALAFAHSDNFIIRMDHRITIWDHHCIPADNRNHQRTSGRSTSFSVTPSKAVSGGKVIVQLPARPLLSVAKRCISAISTSCSIKFVMIVRAANNNIRSQDAQCHPCSVDRSPVQSL